MTILPSAGEIFFPCAQFLGGSSTWGSSTWNYLSCKHRESHILFDDCHFMVLLGSMVAGINYYKMKIPITRFWKKMMQKVTSFLLCFLWQYITSMAWPQIKPHFIVWSKRWDKIKRLRKQKNKRKQEKRANTVLTKEQKETKCVKECKRKQQYRQKEKGLKLSNVIFKNKYRKGKAMKKVSKALPKTPTKK